MKIFSWGANGAGQLGHNIISEQISEPREINVGNFLSEELAKALNVDNEKSEIAIKGGGTHTVVWIVHPEAGVVTVSVLGSIRGRKIPESSFRCSELSEKLLPKSKLAIGWDFNFVLLRFEGKTVLSLSGDNRCAQLGIEDDGLHDEWYDHPTLTDPSIMIVDVSAGLKHGGAVGLDGRVWLWGDGSRGQIGMVGIHPQDLDSSFVEPDYPVTPPKEVTKYLKFSPKLIRCTKNGTILLSNDNKLYGIGQRKFGLFQNLGTGTEKDDYFQKLFPDHGLESFLNGAEIVDVQCGWNHVLVLLSNGLVGSFGRNNFGQLGRKLVLESETMGYDSNIGLVENLPEKMIQIACGTEHNLLLGESGACYSFGWNEHDSCGVEPQLDIVWKPTKVPIPDTEKVIDISTGAGNSFAITKTR